jgi:hypothetical protein
LPGAERFGDWKGEPIAARWPARVARFPTSTHICLDAPTPSQLVDVRGFNVRGWSWLDAAHDELVAVEVWTGDKLLGRTEKLGLRSDVTAELKLPAGVRTGFHLVARHPRADGWQGIFREIFDARHNDRQHHKQIVGEYVSATVP